MNDTALSIAAVKWSLRIDLEPLSLFYDGLAAVYQSAADGLPPRTGYIDHAGQWAEPPAPFQGIEVSLQRIDAAPRQMGSEP